MALMVLDTTWDAATWRWNPTLVAGGFRTARNGAFLAVRGLRKAGRVPPLNGSLDMIDRRSADIANREPPG